MSGNILILSEYPRTLSRTNARQGAASCSAGPVEQIDQVEQDRQPDQDESEDAHLLAVLAEPLRERDDDQGDDAQDEQDATDELSQTDGVASDVGDGRLDRTDPLTLRGRNSMGIWRCEHHAHEGERHCANRQVDVASSAASEPLDESVHFMSPSGGVGEIDTRFGSTTSGVLLLKADSQY